MIGYNHHIDVTYKEDATMKNNVIELYTYQDSNAFDYTGFNRRAELRFRNAQIRYWISTVVDVFATTASAGCTVFCCYLALTML